MSKNAYEQAKAQFESIQEMVAALDTDDDTARERAEQEILEDPLEVSVRTGWYSPGEHQPAPEEFRILLCTGGPAVQIIGLLDGNNHPWEARLQYQDWFEPWTDYHLSDEDADTLLRYCQCFYFGD